MKPLVALSSSLLLDLMELVLVLLVVGYNRL